MSGILEYLAARSLRESAPTASGEQPVRPAVRPRVPTFYEAAQEASARDTPARIVEEEETASADAGPPTAARSSLESEPDPGSARSAVATHLPHPRAASSPPRPPARQDDHAQDAATQDHTSVRSPPRRPDEQRDGEKVPTSLERSAAKPPTSDRNISAAAQHEETARIPAPARERATARTRAVIEPAAPERASAPLAPAMAAAARSADVERSPGDAQPRGPGLVPRIEAPREVPGRRPDATATEQPSAAARVQVSIGRIEIRAAYAPPRPPPAPRPGPAISLDDYLAKRERGGT